MEIWKTIEGFEDYEVSNFGRVKSFKCGKEKILTLRIDFHGYYKACLHTDKIPKTMKIHQLVAIAFLDHKTCGHKLVVNHIDFNKLNNHVDNLEIITQRENANQKHLSSSSQYVGVSWIKSRNKWKSAIINNNKKFHLGYFTNEIDASNAYQNKLTQI